MTWINYDLFCCFFDVNVRNGYFQKGSRQVDEVGGISLPVKFKSDAVFFQLGNALLQGFFSRRVSHMVAPILWRSLHLKKRVNVGMVFP